MAVPIENNTDALQELLRIANSLPDATGQPVLQAKTVSPTTQKQTVTPDSGYDGLSSVTVNAMQTAQQATPSISVSSSGLITASATQTAGYVSAGTKSATQQLTTQAAKTYTPGTSDQTIAAGRYLTGAQTIKGDANLTAANIAQGVSIFGVAGSLKPGGTMTDTQVTLSASGWSSKKQTVSVSGVTAGSTIVVYSDDASEPEYGMCGVKCSGQANGTLTFSCDYLPLINLAANVLIFT